MSSKKSEPVAVPIGSVARVILLLCAVVLVAIGGLATFLTTNEAGSAAMIAAGALGVLIGGIGHWPQRFAVGGNSIEISVQKRIDDMVDKQIEVATEAGASRETLDELQRLRNLLAHVQPAMGGVHPAEKFDLEVARAISRVLPEYGVARQPRDGDRRFDMHLTGGDARIVIETKWLRDPSAPFLGSTLDRVIARLAPDEKLLVVVNISNDLVPAKTRQKFAAKASIVGWRDSGDDLVLRAAILARAR
jgi:hypothetical protein